MILIADSGSTKCDWALIGDAVRVTRISTIGFNPFYHDADAISNTLKSEDLFVDYSNRIKKVYFYGAGCSSKKMCKIVSTALKAVFPKAKIKVEHDVLGAAIASCQREKGIACILGTGSNSCYYDGKSVKQGMPSLGYILGDEGSGSWYGRRLVRDYLYGEDIPIALKKKLKAPRFDKDTILENVYMKPHANVYLASFMKLLSEHKRSAYVQEMLHEGMRTFFERHVCCFKNHRKLPVNFVGSVAYYHQDILKEEAEKLKLTVGNVIRQPIDGLVKYHIKKTKD